jgi:hypothetical protein
MIGQSFGPCDSRHVGNTEYRNIVFPYNNKNPHIPAKQLCPPSLQRILTVLKPGTMPSFLHLYEGVLPW